MSEAVAMTTASPEAPTTATLAVGVGQHMTRSTTTRRLRMTRTTLRLRLIPMTSPMTEVAVGMTRPTIGARMSTRRPPLPL